MLYPVKHACGHEMMIEDSSGIKEFRDWKLKEYARNLCPSCLKEKILKETPKNEIIANVELYPYCPTLSFMVHITGDTYQYKNVFKSNGFLYDDISRGGVLGGFSSFRSEKGWQKFGVNIQDLINILDKTIALFPDIAIKFNFSDMDIRIWADNMEKFDAKKEEVRKRFSAVERPSVPSFISGKWNNKLYGSRGKYKIYIDGDEKMLTDSESDETKVYLTSWKKYLEEAVPISDEYLELTGKRLL